MTFQLSMGDLEQAIFEGEINSLIVPGADGYMEILSHHAPLLTTLKPGRITITRPGEKILYSVTSGLLEVQNNTALLLADSLQQI